MATEAQPRRRGARSTGKRRQDKDLARYQERLKLLRLDFHTLVEQIQILDHELQMDPCLTGDAMAVILSLIDALKQELEASRLRILDLKGSTAA
ncbi:MAG: hypothetical protein LJE58_10015 [Thiogranum sp.]|jgi:hypothetical protein|nr:hypothetical protein [Thiogranum sp.]